MRFPSLRTCNSLIVMLSLLCTPLYAGVRDGDQSSQWGPHSIGGLHSWGDSSNGISFDQAEAVYLGHTPAHWHWSWATLETQYAAGAGYIKARGESSTMVGAGVNFDLLFEVPISLQLGIRPTWLKNATFDGKEKDMGGNFHFNSNLGVYYYWPHLILGVRVNHISNAGTNDDNPGIDFWSVELRYLFDRRIQQSH